MNQVASSIKSLTNHQSQPITNSDSSNQSQFGLIETVSELSVCYRSIESLKPYPGNARTHSPAQIRKVKESIRVFGFVNPVLIHTDGTIIAGHGRVQAAKLLGMTEVPTICLSRGTLYHLLSNPLYIGKTRHGGKLYDGQHQAIIAQKTWDQAADLLASNRVKRRTSHNVASGRSLLGVLFDERENRFTPTHASKKGRRYAYYTLQTDDGTATTRLPALEFEQLVVRRIRDLLSKPLEVAAQFPDLTVKDKRLAVAAGHHRAEQLAEVGSKDAVRLIRNILNRVIVREADIQIEINRSKLRSELLGNDNGAASDHDAIKLSAPLLIKRRGSEVRLVLENGEPSEHKPIPSLTKAVAWSRHWADQIVSGKLVTMEDLAKSAGISKIHARRILRCAALSPDLTAQILDGKQPVDLTLDSLTRSLPLFWAEQHL